ncbi:hypothetical protein [Pseudovibrio sp. Ad37]|uniref:hypothetical protein n=1 Tax=Pseudovibrio sp. Ad37 TaxID=989422 RepID=UPI0012905837|nr:hypothetical protein [Pseudovibrio sp. Ad37]
MTSCSNDSVDPFKASFGWVYARRYVAAEDTILHTTGETQYLTIIDCSEVRADKSSGVSQRTISMKPYDGKWHVSLACDDDPQSELYNINVLRLK